MNLKNCLAMKSKRAYILLADGFEALEVTAPIDVLCRAGVELCRVAVGGTLDVVSSHALMSLRCDVLIEDADMSDGDILILPGGNPGYINLRSSARVRDVVRQYFDSGRLVAAICGAPTVLAASGVAEGRMITCHSSVIAEMDRYNYRGGCVVEDGNLLTAAGAGCSVEFALAIASRLVDAETMARTRKGMEL